MSKPAPDQQFWDLADSFIRLANEQSKAGARDKVSAALLYAASRFNAFVAATASSDEATFRAAKDEAMEYFSGEFRKMLGENLDDWANNYEKYMGSKRDDGA
jgi:Protein of unknown function (DUF3144)